MVNEDDETPSLGKMAALVFGDPVIQLRTTTLPPANQPPFTALCNEINPFPFLCLFFFLSPSKVVVSLLLPPAGCSVVAIFDSIVLPPASMMEKMQYGITHGMLQEKRSLGT